MKKEIVPLVITLVLLITQIFATCILPVKSQTNEIIYINSDGSVTGTNNIQRNGDLYTFTGDINGSVSNGKVFFFILKDNITIDGSNHVLQGSGTGIGINLRSRQNVTIENLVINNFGSGIGFWTALNLPLSENDSGSRPTALNNQILNNTITAPFFGIDLAHANGTVISGNTIISTNPKNGMSLSDCGNTLISNNKLIGGTLTIWSANQLTLLENTVDNKPLIYLNGASNQIIDGAGQVFLIDCNNMTIKNVNPPPNSGTTIQLQGTNTSQITNCTGQIFLSSSHYNTISNSQLTGNTIELANSSHNVITRNTLNSTGKNSINLEYSNTNNIYANNVFNSGTGIRLVGSLENNIFRNNLTSNDVGVALTFIVFTSFDPRCINNSVYENIIDRCKQGVSLGSAYENKIFRNNITSADQGIRLYCSDNNTFYNNNFLDNTQHAYEEHSVWSGMGYDSYYSKNNAWNSSTLVGGNYWTGYVGVDNDGDGLGDTPYAVDGNNIDYLPITKPLTINNTYSIPTWSIPSPPIAPTPTTSLSETPQPTHTNSPTPPPEIPTQTLSPTLQLTIEPTQTASSAVPASADFSRSIPLIVAGIIISVIVTCLIVLVYFKKPKRS